MPAFLIPSAFCGALWGGRFGAVRGRFPAHTLKYRLIAVISVIQRSVHTTDRSGGCSRLLGNLKLGIVIFKHGGYLEPLGDGYELIDRT